MNAQKTGIAVAGNIIADMVKSINEYPEKGMLAVISDVSVAVGGCAPNTAIDLAKIDNTLHVSAIGRVGNDANGKFVVDTMKQNSVDTDMVITTDNVPTAFSDVMSVKGGERTFFTYSGANAVFSPEDIDLSKLSCKLFHIGYILLLDMFDKEDSEYGTVMAGFLKDVQKRGIKTSIDCVSNSEGDFGAKIIPALKYSDYVIINEIECCNIWGFSPRTEDGKLDVETLKLAMQKMIEAGVKEKVIIHCKEAGFCLSSNGKFTAVGSLDVDKKLFKGSVGAGDAFCAGSLYGIYNGYSDKEILEFASAAAVCNLFEANSIDGMRSKEEIIKIKDSYERIKI